MLRSVTWQVTKAPSSSREDGRRSKGKVEVGNLHLKKKNAVKSNVWDRFSEVVSAGDNSSIGYVRCNSCEKIYKHESHKTGTSSLSRHICGGSKKNEGSVTSQIITAFLKSKVPAHVKSEVTDSCVELCCRDLRPFDIVSGDGFHTVAQCLINIGSRYGRVDASSVLPHRQTVCDRAKATAKEKKEILSKKINKALDFGIAITTDMWTDEFNKRAYTAFTGHFINDDWKLESRVISTAEFDSALKKTAHNIHEQIITELHDFGIEPAHMSKVMFVSDQGANIKAALRSYKWMPCTAHVINIVLKHTFDVKERDCPQRKYDPVVRF
ncbi:hypothetical protein QQF64_020349 [Cirrhinus molitorella]|uniref:BED-type domain-containing protein n=1 Tax=Cirrhinus molitorella TaxID=172907 RepID=A0ABR3LCD4_9TELE